MSVLLWRLAGVEVFFMSCGILVLFGMAWYVNFFVLVGTACGQVQMVGFSTHE